MKTYIGHRVILTTYGGITYGAAGTLRVHHFELGCVYLIRGKATQAEIIVPLKTIKSVRLFREKVA